MLKHSRTFLVWSCFAFVIAAFALIGAFSPSYQECTANHERQYSQNKQTDLHEGVSSRVQRQVMPVFLVCEGAFIDENNGTLTALATIAIAGFTLILWQATSRQARLTREAIELGNKEFNVTHRPQIIVRTFEQCTEIGSGLLGASITYINIGSSPATIVELRGKILWDIGGLRPGILEMVASEPDKPRTVAVGEEGSYSLFSTYTFDGAGAISGRQALGTGRLVCIGYLRYTDANGIERKTGFCRRYEEGLRLWVRLENEDYEYAY